MASSSKQVQASVLMVAALLLLICTTSGQAARPEPGSKDHMPLPQVFHSAYTTSSCFILKFSSSAARFATITGHASYNLSSCYLQLAVLSGTVAGHEKSGSVTGVEMDHEDPQAMRECEGGDEGEECLMRRTLVAHTDYIYTQGKHN